MQIRHLHDWDLKPADAIALQRELAARIDHISPVTDCSIVAGCDVSYERFSNVIYAGVVVIRLSDGMVIERRGATCVTNFPYVPGLLTFREAPALLQALSRVEAEPDVVVLDGQGIAHPRRIGLASHVGLSLNRPCIGCAKSHLTGDFNAAELAPEAGASVPLVLQGEVVGAVLRSKKRCKPLFVSPGHKVDVASSIRWVIAACRGYRMPEPTRLADQYVNALRRGEAEM